MNKQKKTPLNMKPGYLRRADAAKYMQISIRSLADHQRRRAIPFSKIGKTVLFKITDLDAFVGKFRINAKGAAEVEKGSIPSNLDLIKGEVSK